MLSFILPTILNTLPIKKTLIILIKPLINNIQNTILTISITLILINIISIIIFKRINNEKK